MPVTLDRATASGVYPVQDAALFVSATSPRVLGAKLATGSKYNFTPTTRHLYRWVNEGLASDYLQGLHGDEVALTFRDLISMRMVSVLRSVGLKPREIRIAHQRLKERRGWDHPFAMEPIWAGGLDLVIRDSDIAFSVTRDWQMAFDFITEYLVSVTDLVFSEDESPVSWEPIRNVILHPAVRFGEPCLKGTRIPTEAIWGFHEAGDSVSALARSYSVPESLIESALSWEEKLAKST